MRWESVIAPTRIGEKSVFDGPSDVLLFEIDTSSLLLNAPPTPSRSFLLSLIRSPTHLAKLLKIRMYELEGCDHLGNHRNRAVFIYRQ